MRERKRKGDGRQEEGTRKSMGKKKKRSNERSGEGRDEGRRGKREGDGTELREDEEGGRWRRAFVLARWGGRVMSVKRSEQVSTIAERKKP